MRHLRNAVFGSVLAIVYTVVCWWIWEGPAWSECRRVVERADGVSVIAPARGDQQLGETEAAWCAREFERAIEADPSLQGRPFHDVDSANLPTDRSQRNKWRYRGGLVQVDPTVPDPPPSKEQQRKAVCGTIILDPTASQALKDLCATF